MNICKPAGILTTEWCDGTDGWGADVAKDLPAKSCDKMCNLFCQDELNQVEERIIQLENTGKNTTTLPPSHVAYSCAQIQKKTSSGVTWNIPYGSRRYMESFY